MGLDRGRAERLHHNTISQHYDTISQHKQTLLVSTITLLVITKACRVRHQDVFVHRMGRDHRGRAERLHYNTISQPYNTICQRCNTIGLHYNTVSQHSNVSCP